MRKPQTSTTMKYRSRISILILIIIFCATFYPMLDGKDLLAKGIALGTCYIFTMLIIALLFLTISYTITDNSIAVRMLGTNWATIPISRIKTIKRSYNPISSPAASLKRLEVKYLNNGIVTSALISPVREAEFLEKIKEINPNIEIRVTDKRNILRFWDWDI